MKLSKRLKVEMISHINSHFTADLYVTMTFKQTMPSETRFQVRMNEETLSKEIRHILNVLNRSVYGNAYHRFDKRVEVVPSIEGRYSVDKRLHVHMGVAIPDKYTVPDEIELFKCLIERAYLKSSWAFNKIKTTGKHNILIKDAYDTLGFLKYNTKEGYESIDVINMHININRNKHIDINSNDINIKFDERTIALLKRLKDKQ